MVLEADGREMARAETGWTRETWRVDGQVNVRDWQLVPEAYRDLASNADIEIEGRRRPGLALTEARARTDSGFAIVAPTGDGAWTVLAEAEPGTLAILTSGHMTARTARWSGRVERGPEGLRLDGEFTGDGVVVDGIAAETVAGPLAVQMRGGRYRIETRLALGTPRTGMEPVDAVVGTHADLDFTGHWVSRDRALEIEHVLAETAHARLEGSGRYPLGGRPPSVEARLTIRDVARLTDQASGPLDVSIGAVSRSRAELVFDAHDVRWSQTHIDLLNGLQGSLVLEHTDSGWQVHDIAAQADGLDLRGQGATRPGGWTLDGDLAIDGRLPVDTVEVDGALATAFRVVSRGGRIELRTATRSRTITAGPVTVDAPELAAETVWENGALTVDWILEATRNGKPVNLSGAARYAGNTWSARLDESRLGPFLLSASAERTATAINARFDMELGDRATSQVRYTAPPSAWRDGIVDAELIVRGHAFSGGYLAEATLRLDGPLSGMDVRATATGRLRSPLTLNSRGRLAVGENGEIALSMSPSGRWSIHRFRTTEPFTMHYQGGDYDAGGTLDISGGELAWQYRRTGMDADLAAVLTALPVAVIADIADFPPAEGTLSGETRLLRRDGSWRGSSRLDIEGLAGLAAENADPVAIAAGLDIADDARIDIELSGNGLSGTGFLTRAGPTPRLAALVGSDGSAVEGHLELSGDIVGLAALVAPADFTVHAGRLFAEVDLGGERGSPDLAGQLELEGGDLTIAATGATVRELDLAASFDGSALQLARLSASDGEAGRLTGSGELRLPAEGARGEAALEFERFTAARRDDLSVQASGTADITLDDRGLLISGTTNVDRARIRPTLNGAASIPEIDVQEINLPKGRQSYSRNVLPMRLDYAVRADRNVYISSSTFSSEWGLDLTASGPVGKPEISGQATLLDGTAFVFNRRFRLDGRARSSSMDRPAMPGPTSPPPTSGPASRPRRGSRGPCAAPRSRCPACRPCPRTRSSRASCSTNP